MLLTVYCVRQDLTEVTFSLEVDSDFELENFRALCELESGIPAAQSEIVYAERPLTDNQRSLSSYGLKDGDVVVLRQRSPAEPRPAAAPAAFPGLPRIDFSRIAVPGTSNQPPLAQPRAPPPPPPPDSTSIPQGLDNPTLLREMLLANPHELSLLKERNPPLAEALLSGDLEKFTKVLLEQQQERARREQERIRLFAADPFDLEAQAKIEEDIRQQNIEENMTIAMEEAPESFGQVVMLYINCKVNGYPVKAFVDSGAQMTIMSQACAERCHIMRLVDRRWAGIAKGVGTQKIIGRVHLAQVQIEGDFLPCSFSILEEQPMDMLLGLDMLKRHQCSIDLEKNVLVIGTTGTRTSFLPEGELPECARLAYGPGREDMHPEEIADRELAEVLQKSADEAGKETTSLNDPSLVPPTEGRHNPARTSGTASNSLAPSVSVPTTIHSHPSMVAESTEALTDLFKAEDFKVKSEVSPTKDDIQAGNLPPILTPIEKQNSDSESLDLCKETVLSGPSPRSGADPSTERILILDQLASDPGLEGLSDSQQLLDTCNKTCEVKQPLAPLGIHNHGNEFECNLQSDVVPTTASLSHTGILGQGSEEGLGDSMHSVNESPMEIDTTTISQSEEDISLQVNHCDVCKSHECTKLQGHGAPPQSAATDHMSFADGVQFKNDKVSSGVSGSTDSISGDNCTNAPNTYVQDEPQCFSLATALKELHKLLVISNQESCRTQPMGKSHNTDTNPEDKDDHLLEPCHNGILNNQSCSQSSEDASDSGHVVSEGEISFLFSQTVCDTRSADQGQAHPEYLPYKEDCSKSDVSEFSDVVCPSEARGDYSLDSAEAVGPPLSHRDCPVISNSDKNPKAVTDPSVVPEKDPGCDETIPEIHPDAGRPQCDLPAPAADSHSNHSAPMFPASAVEWIVNAGFTLQDAIHALERADGDAELALLSLLAKNIIVPT
ncbi:regulatory solute carrier protein family 1 member 1 isoform X1 [Bombina bombina]|uniref:regulatory solute carrier protein family 1 member 1 isoform X1 n=1 Tax=Bombina bombina TaxID=8345 RepID=UPI00235AE8AF|nr:regulatory solute carrier protein family 1 member 1 isoform X1 [Bombina bombina]